MNLSSSSDDIREEKKQSTRLACMLGGKAQQRKGLSMLAFSARLLTVVFLIYSPRVGASHAFFDVGLASRRQFDIAVAIQQASSGKGSMDGMAGAQEMMTRLYLGCAKAAQNRTLLEKLKIKSVLIVADDVHPAFPGILRNRYRLLLPDFQLCDNALHYSACSVSPHARYFADTVSLARRV